MSSDLLKSLLVLAIAVTLAWPVVSVQDASSDLLALWLAGGEVAAGRPTEIYPNVADVFLIRPPDTWEPLARNIGHAAPIYPFIYPPIWAYAMAPLTEWMSFRAFASAVRMVNLGLLVAIGALAWRACRPPMGAFRYVAATQILFYGTLIGALAIYEDQPHILVSFLLVLAIERSQAKAPGMAGAALGLAAAIKLAPALLIVPLLALPGRARALAGFVVVGGGLGLASLALAGWPLHRQFLDLVSSISATAIAIGASFSVDRVIAGLFLLDEMTPVSAMTTSAGPPPGWLVLAKPALWSTAGMLALVSVVAVATVALPRVAPTHRAGVVWPVTLIITALLSPLAWMHYFIAPLAFAPLLLVRFALLPGGLLLIALIGPFSFLGIRLGALIGVDPVQNPAWGFAAMLLLALAFVLPVPSRLRLASPYL